MPTIPAREAATLWNSQDGRPLEQHFEQLLRDPNQQLLLADLAHDLARGGFNTPVCVDPQTGVLTNGYHRCAVAWQQHADITYSHDPYRQQDPLWDVSFTCPALSDSSVDADSLFEAIAFQLRSFRHEDIWLEADFIGLRNGTVTFTFEAPESIAPTLTQAIERQAARCKLTITDITVRRDEEGDPPEEGGGEDGGGEGSRPPADADHRR